MRMLRFSLLALAVCVLAVPGRADELLPADRALPDVVDHYIESAWKDQDIKPAPLADDITLIRRLTLDLNGRIPTAAEVSAYVASADADKKTKLVDRLMASPAFLRHQVNEFDTLLASEPSRRGQSGNLREYLTGAFKDNRPWDAIFRDLIVADEKEPATKGSAQFLKARVKDLDRLTNDVSVLFFGVNISCAQCHDHPLVRDWKQDHYYGMKSFFARTFEAGPFLGERDLALVQFKTTKNETKTASLMFLTSKKLDDPVTKLSPEERKKLEAEAKQQAKNRGKEKANTPPPPPKFSARAALADLALQADQREFFARAIVNRMWYRFFGMGLVAPLDQMHSENAASHPELLAWLARDTAENKYDLRRLIRGLVLSKTYARSSVYEGDRHPSPRTFAVAKLRALTPMQLAASLRLAVSDPDQFPASLKADELEKRIEQVESAGRGLAGMFEQPRDDFQISVTEALLFSNNERIQRELLADHAGTLLGKMKAAKSPDEAIELAYRGVMSRGASEEEKKAMLDFVAARRDRLGEAYKQMVWALLSSAEFRFNY